MPDSFSLSRIEDFIDKVKNSVPKFGLLKGNYSIKLTKNIQDLASFVTPHILFYTKVIPFGLRNVSVTFDF